MCCTAKKMLLLFIRWASYVCNTAAYYDLVIRRKEEKLNLIYLI